MTKRLLLLAAAAAAALASAAPAFAGWWTLPRAEYELRIHDLPILTGNPPVMIPDPPFDYLSGIYGDAVLRADCQPASRARARAGRRYFQRFRCRVDVYTGGESASYLLVLRPMSGFPDWSFLATGCVGLTFATPSCPSP